MGLKQFSIIITLLAVGVWGGQLTAQDVPLGKDPVQAQMNGLLASMRDSEAETASGAYVPGMGATFVVSVVRGPNSTADKNAVQGTLDWGIYLMRTFGGQLTTVPENEFIALSIQFYDYEAFSHRQLVIRSRAADAGNPEAYVIWINGTLLSGNLEAAHWTVTA